MQPGENPSQALQHSLDLAVLAESLGYHRIWFAEHHAKSLVGRSPEVLIAAAAARTKTIRIGSGAVLLNHYSAYRVAEVFCTLNELYPGRIDLGVGRATTGPVTDLALQQDRSKPFHPDSDSQLTELINWLQNSFESDSILGSVPIHSISSRPQLHLTGTSPWSARAAGERGLRYVFASFFNQFQPENAWKPTESVSNQLPDPWACSLLRFASDSMWSAATPNWRRVDSLALCRSHTTILLQANSSSSSRLPRKR